MKKCLKFLALLSAIVFPMGAFSSVVAVGKDKKASLEPALQEKAADAKNAERKGGNELSEEGRNLPQKMVDALKHSANDSIWEAQQRVEKILLAVTQEARQKGSTEQEIDNLIHNQWPALGKVITLGTSGISPQDVSEESQKEIWSQLLWTAVNNYYVLIMGEGARKEWEEENGKQELKKGSRKADKSGKNGPSPELMKGPQDIGGKIRRELAERNWTPDGIKAKSLEEQQRTWMKLSVMTHLVLAKEAPDQYQKWVTATTEWANQPIPRGVQLYMDMDGTDNSTGKKIPFPTVFLPESISKEELYREIAHLVGGSAQEVQSARALSMSYRTQSGGRGTLSLSEADTATLVGKVKELKKRGGGKGMPGQKLAEMLEKLFNPVALPQQLAGQMGDHSAHAANPEEAKPAS